MNDVQVAAYLDRRLSPLEREQVEAHLAECVECRQEIVDTHQFLRRRRRSRPLLLSGVLAAAAALSLVALPSLPDPSTPSHWLAPESFGSGRFNAINDAGQMAGHTPVGSNSTTTPAYWGDGTIGTRLLPVGGNGWSGSVRGVSMAGIGGGARLVGTTYSSSGRQVAVWWPLP
jgi:Putative zinc-finger